MKGTYLGEFEELIMLTVGVLNENAYGLSVKNEVSDQSGRKVTLSAVHASLNRLEEKGFLESGLGEASKERGGKRKRLFKITNMGRDALQNSRSLRDQLWDRIPEVVWTEKMIELKRLS
ncbi:MAG: helix-turn-helix transcriptional regulator [Reichenbachiella sp.]